MSNTSAIRQNESNVVIGRVSKDACPSANKGNGEYLLSVQI